MKPRRRRKRKRGRIPNLDLVLDPYQEQIAILQRQLKAAPAAITAQVVHPLVGELLQILDDLDRALASSADGIGLRDGIVLIQQTMEAIMLRHGVERLAAVYQPFNPELHHAVQRVIRPDLPPGYVLEVIQDGFLMGGQLLRPAMVVVTTAG